MANVSGYSPYTKTALFRDTVMTFAYGIHNMVSQECPQGFLDKSLLKICVHNGPLLLQYMKNVTFEGSYGTVQFDERGDADGKYEIDQLQKIDNEYVVRTIGDVGQVNSKFVSHGRLVLERVGRRRRCSRIRLQQTMCTWRILRAAGAEMLLGLSTVQGL